MNPDLSRRVANALAALPPSYTSTRRAVGAVTSPRLGLATTFAELPAGLRSLVLEGERRRAALTAAVTAATEEHTGAMVALIPAAADLDRLVVDGGESRDELHLTLWYLGEAADLSPDVVDELRVAAREAASAAPGPAEVPAFGVGLWNWAGDEPSVVLNVGDPDSTLRDVREAVGRAGGDLLGDWPPVYNHLPWAPHVCLAYADDLAVVSEALTRLGTISFDRLRLAVAGDVYDYPLGG